MNISALKPDDKNANRGTKRGRALVAKSIEQYGAGRSVLIDRDGRLIAGNKTVEQAAAAGINDVIVVPTDGTQLVAVQRTDLSLDDPKARGLAVADNRAGELGLEWDPAALAELSEVTDLSAMFEPTELVRLGVTEPEFAPASADEQGKLDEKKKVTCPQCGHEFNP